MNQKIIATMLGVAGAILWFTPFAYIDFMGVEGFQAGHHIGGIAYLLLLSSLAYAVLSWMEQTVPRLMASGVACAIGLLFAVQAGSSIAWGLLALLAVSMASVALAVASLRSAQTQR